MPGVRCARLRPPARRRLAMACHHRHVAAHDDLDVERLPQAALLVLRVVLPEPGPLLEPQVREAVLTEEHVGGIVAPDRFERRPVVRGVGAEIGIVSGENLLAFVVHVTSTISSISTDTLDGRLPIATAERACTPRSPQSFTN